MADIKIFLPKIPNKLEGDYYLADDVSSGVGTSCGCSVGSIKTATGKVITESQLKNLRCKDDLIQKNITWYWNKISSNQYPQEIAEIFADFVFNKGLGRCIIIQNMLIYRYKANITADGIWGAKSTGALIAAIEKYGENHVYDSIYAWRWCFYTGINTPDKSGSKNAKGYEKPNLNLQETRLKMYFPPKSNFNPEDLLKAVDTEGVNESDVLKNAASSSAKEIMNPDNPDRFKNMAIIGGAAVFILVVLYFIFKFISNKQP
jgi:lysozyme family protein